MTREIKDQAIEMLINIGFLKLSKFSEMIRLFSEKKADRLIIQLL